MCEVAVDHAGRGVASSDLLQRGQDRTHLEAFILETRPYWRALVCRDCDRDATGPLCRSHLTTTRGVDLGEEVRALRDRIDGIGRHLVRYARSFR